MNNPKPNGCEWILYDEIEFIHKGNNPINLSKALELINKGKYLGTYMPYIHSKLTGGTALYTLIDMIDDIFDDNERYNANEFKKLTIKLIETGKSNPGQYHDNDYTPTALFNLLFSASYIQQESPEDINYIVDVAKSIIKTEEYNPTCKSNHKSLFLLACSRTFLEPVAIDLMLDDIKNRRTKSPEELKSIIKLAQKNNMNKLLDIITKQNPLKNKIIENIPSVVEFRNSKTAKRLPIEIRNSIIRSTLGGRRRHSQHRKNKNI